MSVPTYKDLTAWQIAMNLVEKCYATTEQFPSDERFSLTAQIRRAAISIPANIAEGASRKHRKASANHISIALGSHAELETYIELVRRLGFLSGDHLDDLIAGCIRTGQLLHGLHRSLTRSKRNGVNP